MNAMQMRRILLSLILSSLVALVGVSVASADAPVFVGPVHQQFSLPGIDCGEFQVILSSDLYYTEQYQFDHTGTLVKIIAQV